MLRVVGLSSHTNIAVVSLDVFSEEDIGQYGAFFNCQRQNKLDYCLRHGLDFFDESLYYSKEPDMLPVQWWMRNNEYGKYQKIRYLEWFARNYDHNEYEWIFWVDSDAFFMKPEIRIHDKLNELLGMWRRKAEGQPGGLLVNVTEEPWLIMAHDWLFPNNGVFFLRNNERMHQFLRDVYFTVVPFSHPVAMTADQVAFNEVVERDQEIMARTYIVPHDEMRALQAWVADYVKGDFLLHMAGLSVLQRILAAMEMGICTSKSYVLELQWDTQQKEK